MASGQSPISPERCVAIERATGAVVSRRDLWPDGWDRVWPELKEAARGHQ
ncbi:YdaS family helix-turn-helix protein [Achromobacter sp. SS2-2022]|nr:YdaS family helix-turn-helix protein [Achromobacter sp. SS2-2022]WEX97451.1 YdaS family helix-turn-helix protein [Achromobacter sp. SS2-2022]